MNRTIILKPSPEFTPQIGLFVAQMEELRRETKRYVQDLSAEQLSWHPTPKVESMGTLLLHIAAVELSWIQEDILRQPMDEEWRIAFPIRYGTPQLTGESLAFYVEKLDAVRSQVRPMLQTLQDNDLERTITPLDAAGDANRTEYSIRWILFHLIDHEAHHKGQIAQLKRLLPV